jgi:hypothetical protein
MVSRLADLTASLMSPVALNVFGKFLGAEAVAALLLTLSPQITGRAERTNRPGIVGLSFPS